MTTWAMAYIRRFTYVPVLPVELFMNYGRIVREGLEVKKIAGGIQIQINLKIKKRPNGCFFILEEGQKD